jgi:hypothetical protein
MINRWLVHPLLKVTTWIKRNPGLALLVALIIWILPTPITVCSWITNLAVAALEKVSQTAAAAVLKVSTAFLNWLGRAPGRCFWAGFAILPLSPFIGASMMFWCAIQSIKFGSLGLSIFNPTPEPEKISTLPVPVTPDKTDNPFDFGFPTG